MAVRHSLPNALNVVMDILAHNAIRAIIWILKKTQDLFLVSKGVELENYYSPSACSICYDGYYKQNNVCYQWQSSCFIVMVQETTKTPNVASAVVLMDFGEVLAMVLVKVEQHS